MYKMRYERAKTREDYIEAFKNAGYSEHMYKNWDIDQMADEYDELCDVV